MTRLSWDEVSERFFETGLDRGVLYPKTGSGEGVPWNGLVSVDEDGGEKVETYFIDGRPYLHYAKPKEYTATLTAFTYPDEFAEIMGLTETEEVAGFFVDSQQGNSFDLAYRTLVGNAVDGIEHGYKIHLVYNAVVNPSSASYETLSDNLEALQFSWEISAVPSPLPGYASTAHVVIDSRKMSSGNLQILESIIYGDASTAPSLPPLNELSEIIRFGDTIFITDNGDGTWSAEGVSTNFEMISDDVFQINDVNAIHNGDETFDISTTNP